MSASIQNPHFLLRRLHSLFGLAPVGFFVMFHMWENSQARLGAEHYNDKVVGFLQGMNYLWALEIFMITLPLLFHIGYGLVIMHSGKTELQRYPWQANWRYWLQRASGIGILAFLVVHVGWTRIWSIWEPSIKADLFTHMQMLLSNPFTLAIYIIGLILSIYHLANGLWSFGIVWGLWTTPRAQQIGLAASFGLGALLLAMGLHGLWGFSQ